MRASWCCQCSGNCEKTRPTLNSSNTFALLLIDSMSQAEEFVVAALGEEVLTTIIDQDITPQLIIADYHLPEDYKGAAGWATAPKGLRWRYEPSWRTRPIAEVSRAGLDDRFAIKSKDYS